MSAAQGTALLLIEDTPSLQLVYETVLHNAGHEVTSVGTAAAGLARFRALRPEVVLLDLMLPDRDGLELMGDLLAEDPRARVIVITANGSIDRAVQAMRAGAYEFLLKPFNEARFLQVIEAALREGAPRQPAFADGPVPRADTPPTSAGAHGFIGSSEAMQRVYARIRLASRSHATVFISGESGTGKEICAWAVHDCSARAKGPFVPLNCGAIPESLLESEVFGHLEGAQPGAVSQKTGAAGRADGGTLFLDEISEMAPHLQTKLLRFLQTSTIQPVGAPDAHEVDVRIICATSRDPLRELARGRLREDLFYRLHVVPIQLPPLRARGLDVIEVAEAALERFSREEARGFKGLSEDVKALFQQFYWPGNVRQVLNVMRNVVVLNDGPIVTRAMLPDDIHRAMAPPRAAPTGPETPQTMSAGGGYEGLDGLVGRPLAEVERLLIERTLARYAGSVPKAARALDIAPSTLYRKLENWARADSSGGTGGPAV